MAAFLDGLRSVPLVGGLLDDVSGRTGLETAAEGARQAQGQANALAQLQWMRQMQGLQEARGATQPYLSLYDKIYGTNMAQGGAYSRGMPGTMPVGPGLPPDTRAVGPDGMAHPNQKLGPGTVYAPITHGRPPAPGTPPPPPPTQSSGGTATPSYAPRPGFGAAMPSGGSTQNTSSQLTLAQPDQGNGNGDILMQYLRQFGAFR